MILQRFVSGPSLNNRKILSARLVAIVVLGIFFSFLEQVEIKAQDDIRLIVRGDDIGMTQGSITAFEKAFRQGVLTSASIIVSAPWFEAAAELSKKNPDWCFGVHLAIIGEWRGYRWRPVLPWDKVSSIVDEDGFFYRYPEELLAHEPDIAEIEAEFRAQIDLAIKKGVDVQYLDAHYLGYRQYPALKDVFIKLAREYDLPFSGMIGETRMRSIMRVPESRKTEVVLERLDRLEPGLWLWVAHPGIDSPEQNALALSHPNRPFPGGGVGKHRAAELDAVTSAEVKSLISKNEIRLMSYADLWRERKTP